MFRAKPAPALPGEEENPYLLSFSDLLAGLLAIFILALVALMIHFQQQAELAHDTREQVHTALARLASVEEIRRELLEEMKKRLRRYDVLVEISDNHAVLSIPESQLHFGSGQWDVPEGKKDTLTLIGHVLAESLQHSDERLAFVDTIFIEGHTDAVPWSGSEMGNWGLSAYRAIAVWQFWTESPGELAVFKTLRNRHGQPLFSVSGYAATRPLAPDEESLEARRRNRRIDLRFTMRAPLTGDLMELLDQFSQAGIQ